MEDFRLLCSFGELNHFGWPNEQTEPTTREGIMKALFIDDRMHEVMRQWQETGSANVQAQFEKFESIERSCALVLDFAPHFVIIGHGLSCSGVNGSHVIKALRAQGYDGKIIANSGGGAEQFERDGVELDGSADREPEKLRQILDALS